MQETGDVGHHAVPWTIVVATIVATESTICRYGCQALTVGERNGRVPGAMLDEHGTSKRAHSLLVVERMAHQKARQQIAARVGAYIGEGRD